MTNPYTQRWVNLHSDESVQERHLAKLEASDASSRPMLPCGKCGEQSYYRPGVGSYQCASCSAVLNYSGAWV